MLESQAGNAIGFSDAQYQAAGAQLVASAAEIFASAELLIKVKEPQPVELRQLRPGQTLFTYLHLAPDPEQASALLASGVNAIAYETVTDDQGGLPLLAPMSAVAGRMAIQAAAHALEKAQGGSGVLLGGVAGVEPGHVCVLGGGVVGINAARMALGLGADVTVLDTTLPRLTRIDHDFAGRIKTQYATHDAIERQLALADAVIGAVLIPGASTPKLVTRAMLGLMKAGSVLVDVSIDQGGCFETSRPTTHSEPVYEVDGIIHYCVANIPGAVSATSTLALTNATLPYVVQLANKGWQKACSEDEALYKGLNIVDGKIIYPAVAEAFGLSCETI
jgi:alanine dehydrogenase